MTTFWNITEFFKTTYIFAYTPITDLKLLCCCKWNLPLQQNIFKDSWSPYIHGSFQWCNVSITFETRIDYLLENKAHDQTLFHLSTWCVEVYKVWRNNPTIFFPPSFPSWHFSVSLTWEKMVQEKAKCIQRS